MASQSPSRPLGFARFRRGRRWSPGRWRRPEGRGGEEGDEGGITRCKAGQEEINVISGSRVLLLLKNLLEKLCYQIKKHEPLPHPSRQVQHCAHTSLLRLYHHPLCPFTITITHHLLKLPAAQMPDVGSRLCHVGWVICPCQHCMGQDSTCQTHCSLKTGAFPSVSRDGTYAHIRSTWEFLSINVIFCHRYSSVVLAASY